MKPVPVALIAISLLLPAMPASGAPDAKAEIGIVTVGDLIYTQPILSSFRTLSPQLVDVLQKGDITFGNLEENLLDPMKFGGAPQAESGGTWLLGPPEVATDLKQMGFTLLSRANNHSMDWGAEGLSATDRLLDNMGIAHAGTGKDLAAAAAPALTSAHGQRVALVSVTTTFPPMSPAQDPTADIPGRAGANVVRAERVIEVSPQRLRILSEIASQLPKRDHPGADSERKVTVLGNTFEANPSATDGVHYSYQANNADMARLVANIRIAAKNAPQVLVSVHSHQSAGLGENGFGLDQETPAFLREMAHRSIDAGATAFVGHGPHILRGIEIYKGRPIFYSLGNFFFMEDQITSLPRDFYEKMDIEVGAKTPAEVMTISRQKRFNDKKYFESAIAKSYFAGGVLKKIEIIPITLGFDGPDALRGVPRVAEGDAAVRILSQLQKMSAEFGTKMDLTGTRGVIHMQRQ